MSCRTIAATRKRSSSSKKIDLFLVGEFARFLGKLKATPEGAG